MITKLVQANGVTKTLLDNMENNKISVFGCGFGEKLTILNEYGKFILFVASSSKQALDIKEIFLKMRYRTECLTEDYNYDNSPFGKEIVDNVLSVLIKLVTSELDALVITPNILKLVVPDVEYIRQGFCSLSVGQNVDVSELSQRLANAGYRRVDLATSKGTYSVRGEIIDVDTFDDKCYRIVLDFDAIESIKEFNPVTLLTSDSVSSVKLSATKYLNLSNELVDSSIMWNLPFATNCNSTIVDYLEDAVLVIDDTKACWEQLNASIKEHNDNIASYIESGNMNSHHKKIVWDDSVKLHSTCIAFQHITNSNNFFRPNKVFNIKCLPTLNYATNHKALVADLKITKGYTTLLFAKSNEGANKVSNLLDTDNISYIISTNTSKVQFGVINIIAKEYPVSANFAEDKILIIGSEQIFTTSKSTKINNNLSSYDGFLPQSGDIVVHTTHGVGRCLGVQCIDISGGKRDYVIVEYKGGDKLYLPVENLDALNKFVGAEQAPALNKLGSTEFVKQKAKVKGELKALAFNLAELYKKRMDKKGFVYPQDDELQMRFENDFGYSLTPDQQIAVEDIKSDMQSGKIMDRLICGDVGFGKTEVALRAIFKTILAGKQVAFMCPTTILSEQHYNTALVRLKKFGVNIQVLNRFKSEKECVQILADVAEGKIDLIVGTHKLLGSKVQFKNLGLLVLDEEQKFGVGDKEKIKNLKDNINVLTLSATPIPRTLNMSLTGIRDISVISTPPTSRLTTSVQVVEFSDALMQNAINRELDRNGQVLVIYNKVQSIYDFAGRVQKLLPEGTIIDVAHGQMERKTLEDAIFRLYNGSTQVLISTTLIENGVDLPNANTLVVVDSDNLGLSQLYQLKGRIGRSDKQAYAYFTFDNKKLLTENAYKRLQAITEFTAMGSGFKIAMRDLEIRGAGNVLGAEQSGHMQKIGYAMYVQLLNEAVAEVRGEKVVDKCEVRIETSLTAFIPTYYVESYSLRIQLYNKISKINTIEELMKVINYIQEMCGELPNEVVNLCKIALIKNLCASQGLKRVVIKQNECLLQLVDAENITNFVERLKIYDYAVFSTQNSPIINFRLDAPLEDKTDMLINFLTNT